MEYLEIALLPATCQSSVQLLLPPISGAAWLIGGPMPSWESSMIRGYFLPLEILPWSEHSSSGSNCYFFQMMMRQIAFLCTRTFLQVCCCCLFLFWVSVCPSEVLTLSPLYPPQHRAPC